MKKILFALVITSQFVLSEKIVAQNYVPFPDSLGKWSESNYNCGFGPGVTCGVSGYLYCQSTDTTISGKEYSLLGYNLTWSQTSHNGMTTSVNNYSFTPPGLIFGAIRGDSSGHVWFRRLNDWGGEIPYCFLDTLGQIFPPDSDVILYDFNLNAGDTVSWKPNNNIVSAVDSVQLLNGEWRRRITFNNDFYGSWIEGIGSGLGLFGAYKKSNNSFGGCNLNCFRIGNSLLYYRFSTTSLDCDHPYLGIDDLKSETGFSLFPNPAVSSVNLFSNQKKGAEFSVVNTLGQKMKEISIPAGSWSETISLENIPSGIYFCVLKTSEGKFVQQKLIVER